MMTTTNGSWTQGYMYDYNLSGNQLLKRSIDSENNIFDDTTYTYDNLGQLLSETSPNYYAAYMYDTRGNIEEKKEGANYPTYYRYDKNNRLVYSYNEYEAWNYIDIAYSYDGNGNMTEKSWIDYYDDGDGYTNEHKRWLEKYEYNGYNQMVKYEDTGEGEVNVEYKYDAIGRRESKKVDGYTTTHRWDGSSIVGESGTRAGTYYRGMNLIGQNRNNTVNYYVNDGHGNITALTNADGTTAGKRDYSAYGNMTTLGGEMNTVFNYCGEYQDSESGMIYLRNRYYSISMCRFTQEDIYWNPSNMIYGDQQFEDDEIKIPDYQAITQSINLYVYCVNDPVNFVDPWGLMISDILNSKNISEHYSDDYVQFAERVFTESIMKTVTTTNPITIVENSGSIIIYVYICLRSRS